MFADKDIFCIFVMQPNETRTETTVTEFFDLLTYRTREIAMYFCKFARTLFGVRPLPTAKRVWH